MKTLLILRHAQASHSNPRLRDHERPLTEQGKQDAQALGRRLAEHGWQPELVLSSTALRARTTAAIVSQACGAGSVTEQRSLYNAAATAYTELLLALDPTENSVLVVGHNPGLESLLYDLTRQSESFSPATLAVVELPVERWAELRPHTRGTLRALLRPDDPS